METKPNKNHETIALWLGETQAVAVGRWLMVLGLLMALVVLPGCIDLSGKQTRENEKLRRERDRLENELRRVRSKFDERDRLMQEKMRLEMEIEQFQQFLEQEGGQTP
ncbi:MAG: hypothetical protein OZSIB_3135 [Candidatus Ozemobacter sibiricus]|jgi:hypothetical protein|uniref:Uncharacterized protein n=1 Tax=Candidatus Ozemobacter sibiricus TaxID=2268124 RepID=A0A367ZRM4_9BACT|nr:MAG: hypothetical protein OZSIB_3135 [Candidatus Ozemobacter sibiricus]